MVAAAAAVVELAVVQSAAEALLLTTEVTAKSRCCYWLHLGSGPSTEGLTEGNCAARPLVAAASLEAAEAW